MDWYLGLTFFYSAYTERVLILGKTRTPEKWISRTPGKFRFHWGFVEKGV